jgi:hypothetical protein
LRISPELHSLGTAPESADIKPQRTDSGSSFDLGVLFQEFPIRIDLESRLFRRGTMVTLTIPSGLKICLAKHDKSVMVAQTCRRTAPKAFGVC